RARGIRERPPGNCEYREAMNVSPERFPDPAVDIDAPGEGEQAAVLAGGCFWCVEAVYKQLDGVTSVTSGYAGGTAETADYNVVSSGRTGHALAGSKRKIGRAHV